MRLYSHRDRAFHLGPLALEALARVPSCEADHTAALPSDQRAVGPAAVAHVLGEYFDLFRRHLTGPVAAGRAPIPDDPALRAANLKASAYFLDASIVGGCRMEAGDWLAEPIPGHTHALVILVEFGREPHVGDPGEAWIAGSNSARTDLRATELRWFCRAISGGWVSPPPGMRQARRPCIWYGLRSVQGLRVPRQGGSRRPTSIAVSGCLSSPLNWRSNRIVRSIRKGRSRQAIQRW